MTGDDHLPSRTRFGRLSPEARQLAREILVRLEAAVSRGDAAAAAALVEEYNDRPGAPEALRTVRAALVAMGAEWKDLAAGDDARTTTTSSDGPMRHQPPQATPGT